MATFIEGHARNASTGAGINGATATIKKHSDGSTVDSVSTSGSGADAGNYEFTEAEILYPGQFYEEVVSGTETALRSSKANGQIGPVRLNDLTRVIKALGQGVVSGFGGDFACTGAGTDMIVDVAAGFALGAGQTYYSADADEVTISAADATNPRIDNIVIRFYPIDTTDEDDVARVDVLAVAGTPAGSPVAPTPTQSTSTFWEEVLCEVEVAAMATTISTAELTDARRYVQTDIPLGSDGEFLSLVSGKPDWVAPDSTDISDFEEAVEDLIGANVVAGSGISVSYSDATGNTTVAATGGGAATITVEEGGVIEGASITTLDFDGTDFDVVVSPSTEANITLAYGAAFEERVEDIIGANVVAGSGISVAYSDATGNTTITASGGGNTIAVENDDVSVASAAGTIDFSDDFTVTEAPSGEANVSLNGTPAHTHGSFQNFDMEASRNTVTDGPTNVTSTSGQTILSDTQVISDGVTYDIFLWGVASLNAPSGNWIEVRGNITGSGISGVTQPWQGTGTVGGERGIMFYAVVRGVVGSGQTITVSMQAKVSGGTGSVSTASFLGQALARGTGGVA